MSLDEETLETVANGGMMDLQKWPAMVEPLLSRLDYIVYNVFPMPESPPSLEFSQPTDTQTANETPSSSNKENADLPTHTPTSALTDRIPDSQPQSATTTTTEPTLPQPLQLLLNNTRSTIRSLFPSKPPHTLQRLAELILRPQAHYRTLPAYLRALDRVVSVTSSADIFPVQTGSGATAPTPQPNGIISSATNGAADPSSTFALFQDTHVPGSDESLGGALLTPIPWLTGASAEAAAAAVGSSPGGEATSEDITLGVAPTEVPSNDILTTESSTTTTSTIIKTTTIDQHQQQQSSPHEEPTTTTTTTIETQAMEGAGGSPQSDPAEDVPHARGPPVVGVEDMGLQDGRGVEMTLSQGEGEDTLQSAVHGDDASQGGGDSSNTQKEGKGSQDAEAKTDTEPGSKDGDGDIELGDQTADSTTVGEGKELAKEEETKG
ncbi:hypothetical protein P168DRAFT_302255 [Aspergillus campestris IBT 28561]|uniref:PPP4R2-domain-containing protein n=1 Tax=Aspergillus campestris (strain IBT 28561) TaxID=1392248 RepID=A0A2I1DBQ7_ASPC2|nr:uncharacterized protein P168DRAFT_302255 [Aspergillus campestris IBT 28561]PKY07298.1 hypothetical protein P168DRAFT_302255 [Aspergillus campestris IBT 28561]